MIEFNKSKTFFKADEEMIGLALQYIDKKTKDMDTKKGLTPMEIIDEIQCAFELTESEAAACVYILGVYVGENKALEEMNEQA